MAQVHLRLGLLAIAASVFGSKCAAIVVDDFSQGPFSQTGASSLVTQTGLDPAHTVGGRRDFSFGASEPPDALVIDPNAGTLSFSSQTNFGSMTLMYGMGGPLGANFTAQGHDRLRFRFSNVAVQRHFAMWLSVNTALPPSSSTPVQLNYGLLALDGMDGILEVPYSRYPTNFANVNTLALDVARFHPGASFVLDEIATAGPPLPGDYNRDGQVGQADLAEWKRYFGKSVLFGGSLIAADGNADGRVDAADYVLWRRNLGPGGGAGSAAHSVPEPVTLLVVVMAFGGLLATRCGYCLSVVNSDPIEAAHG